MGVAAAFEVPGSVLPPGVSCGPPTAGCCGSAGAGCAGGTMTPNAAASLFCVFRWSGASGLGDAFCAGDGLWAVCALGSVSVTPFIEVADVGAGDAAGEDSDAI